MRTAIVLLLGTLVLVPPARGESPDLEAACAAASARLAEIHAEGHVALSAAVGLRGEVVWSEAVGRADLEHDTPATTTTRFRIGSVSKPLTAAGLALLVADGRLDLDAPIQTYVPSFPEKEHPITTRQLAGHLAGIRHYRGREFLSTRHYETVIDGLEIFRDDPLLHEPGTKFRYSSYGWNLLSAAVEAAAEQDYLDYMAEHVFQPLGMTATVPDDTRALVPHRARCYEAHDGSFRNAPFVDNSYKWAGGGFLSTPEDLVRFGMAHCEPGFLDADTLALLFTPLETEDGTPTRYGLGWSVFTKGGRRVGHGGGSVGATAFLWIDRDAGVVVAVLSNVARPSVGRRTAQALARPFLEALSASAPGAGRR